MSPETCKFNVIKEGMLLQSHKDHDNKETGRSWETVSKAFFFLVESLLSLNIISLYDIELFSFTPPGRGQVTCLLLKKKKSISKFSNSLA